MSSRRPTRVLILGGSSEATALAHALADRADVAATISFAGRTVQPIIQPIPIRIGGFGGVEGLASYLREHEIDILVDATHPFAANMADHARIAATRTGCMLVKATRAAWTAVDGDAWTEVATMAEAAAALGTPPRRVFLTIGRLQLGAFADARQHHYLIRTIDPVGSDHRFADATFIEERGPFDVAAEEELMRRHRIDVLVTKNSGGEAAVAKLAAARTLGLQVVLVRRPRDQDAGATVTEALATIEAHGRLARRGV